MDRRLIGIALLCIVLSAALAVAFMGGKDSPRKVVEPIDVGTQLRPKEERDAGSKSRRSPDRTRDPRPDPPTQSTKQRGAPAVSHDPETAGDSGDGSDDENESEDDEDDDDGDGD